MNDLDNHVTSWLYLSIAKDMSSSFGSSVETDRKSIENYVRGQIKEDTYTFTELNKIIDSAADTPLHRLALAEVNQRSYANFVQYCTHALHVDMSRRPTDDKKPSIAQTIEAQISISQTFRTSEALQPSKKDQVNERTNLLVNSFYAVEGSSVEQLSPTGRSIFNYKPSDITYIANGPDKSGVSNEEITNLREENKRLKDALAKGGQDKQLMDANINLIKVLKNIISYMENSRNLFNGFSKAKKLDVILENGKSVTPDSMTNQVKRADDLINVLKSTVKTYSK